MPANLCERINGILQADWGKGTSLLPVQKKKIMEMIGRVGATIEVPSACGLLLQAFKLGSYLVYAELLKVPLALSGLQNIFCHVGGKLRNFGLLHRNVIEHI